MPLHFARGSNTTTRVRLKNMSIRCRYLLQTRILEGDQRWNGERFVCYEGIWSGSSGDSTGVLPVGKDGST